MILYKLRIAPCCALPQSYSYAHFRAACASLLAHNCYLRNRIQSLTHASRVSILSAFSKSCSVMILYKLRIAPCCALPQSYRYAHFRAACASLRAHTCCLRNRIQSLTHAWRVTILSAFSKSCSVMILYKLRIAPCCALPQSYRYAHFRAACASLRAHTCCLRNRIQSLTHAWRVTILSAFSKSLYTKI